MRANSDNYAIYPRYIGTDITFDHVDFIRVDAANSDFSYRITRLDFANELTEQQNIMWKNPLRQWTLSRPGESATITLENGDWVARDAQGNVLDPN